MVRECSPDERSEIRGRPPAFAALVRATERQTGGTRIIELLVPPFASEVRVTERLYVSRTSEAGH